MYINFVKKVFIPMICILVLIGCEKYLPKAYQEEEFAISALDDKACECLNESLGDTIYTSALTNFDTSWVGSAIYANVEEILDSLEANKIKVTESDTSFTIVIPEDIDSNCVSLITESDELVLYLSDFVEVNIINTAGTIVDPESKAISLETIYYAVSPDTIYQDTLVTDIIDCSKLKTRLVYKLSENRNLMQIIKTDKTMSNTFRLVILQNR